MADRVFFIDINDLKEYTTINYAVEDGLLENSIYDGQKIDIEAIVGTRLYKKLEQMITGSTVSGYYKELLDDYIFDTLIKSAEKRTLLWVYSKIRNKGVVNQEGDTDATVDITILNKMKQELSNDFEYYANKLKSYLCENKDNIAEYKDYNPDSKDYYIKPDKTDSYFSGLFLNDVPKRDWRNEA
jgi:hypothetical protein